MLVESGENIWQEDNYTNRGDGDINLGVGDDDQQTTESAVSEEKFQDVKDEVDALQSQINNMTKKMDTLRVPLDMLSKIFSKEWAPSTIYQEDDVIINPSNGYVYKASKDFTSGAKVSEDLANDKMYLVGMPKVPDADRVMYDNKQYTTVEEALDALLYVEPTVALSNNIGTVEMGTTITSVTLSWSANKSLTSIELSDGIGTVSFTRESYTLEDVSITSNESYTITVSDDETEVSDSTSIGFLNSRYWGVSSNTSLTGDELLNLNKQLSSGYSQTKVFDCSGGNYIYFAWPERFGTPSKLVVGGLTSGFTNLGTVEHTNSSGYTESFRVYRSPNLQNGSAIEVTVE
jgi:hypothetical protein